LITDLRISYFGGSQSGSDANQQQQSENGVVGYFWRILAQLEHIHIPKWTNLRVVTKTFIGVASAGLVSKAPSFIRLLAVTALPGMASALLRHALQW